MKKIVLHLLFCIFLVACSKKQSEGPKEHPLVNDTVWISQSVKDIILFKKGSFWVYQDSISNIIDTAKIDSVFYYYTTTTNPNNTSTDCYAEICQIDYTSKIYGKELFEIYWYGGITKGTTTFDWSAVHCPACNSPDGLYTHLDSLRVNNVLYLNINKTYSLYNHFTGYETYHETNIYYTTKDWGVIRWEYLKTSDVNPTIHKVWLLTSANLTK